MNRKSLACVLALTVVFFSGVGLSAAGGNQGGNQGGGGAWDFEKDVTYSVVGRKMYNGCASPPQILELTEGTNHITAKGRKVLDEGGLLQSWDLNLHHNHQAVKAIGYDLVVGADGQPVVENGAYVRAKDADGNFITTEYSIPGTYNFGQRIHRNEDNQFTRHEVFMCNMISHGSKPNVLIHFNGELHIDADGNYTHETENFWCKCVGAGNGPTENGAVDCDAWPENCVPTPLLYQ